MILKARYVVIRLKALRQALPKDGSLPPAAWMAETQELLGLIFEHREDLAADHQALWQEVARHTDNTPLRTSLDKLIRSLNCTDELSFSDSPVIVLTGAGILFLLGLTGASLLYYVLFVG